jgi:cation diffusion facilitator CzcD-associated flavoprotein CzcO
MRSFRFVVYSLTAGFANLVAGTGSLYGLPVLNGPIAPTPQFEGMKQKPGDFVHPGIWHTHDDLERIRVGVAQGSQPWASA